MPQLFAELTKFRTKISIFWLKNLKLHYRFLQLRSSKARRSFHRWNANFRSRYKHSAKYSSFCDSLAIVAATGVLWNTALSCRRRNPRFDLFGWISHPFDRHPNEPLPFSNGAERRSYIQPSFSFEIPAHLFIERRIRDLCSLVRPWYI